MMGNALVPGRVWAADTGCFSCPHKYTNYMYINWLRKKSPLLCLFATAPDVLCNHKLTVSRSLPMLLKIRAAGFKAAFVAQNGFDGAPWDDFDWLFIGGDTDFKLSKEVKNIVKIALRKGKRVHMGRVNSWKRIEYAHSIGCDSVDGTFLKFGPEINRPKVEKWVYRLLRL